MNIKAFKFKVKNLSNQYLGVFNYGFFQNGTFSFDQNDIKYISSSEMTIQYCLGACFYQNYSYASLYYG